MHVSVLLPEVVDALAVVPGGSYKLIDCTLGNAGHSSEVLRCVGSSGVRLLGIDKNPAAIERSKVRLADVPGEKILVHGGHGDLGRLAAENGFEEMTVDGILMDLGVSSEQLEPGAGFSFQSASDPLDMRMDPTQGETAAELLARLDEQSLAEILWKYGEEPRSRRIARAIMREQSREPITTTGRLAAIVTEAVGGRAGARRHPATLSFQALRFFLNKECEELEQAVEAGLRLLKPNTGRLLVISFESTTDRLAKKLFAEHEGKMISLQQGGARWEGKLPAVRRITRRPIVPSEEEVKANPRARSAKLRVVQRV